jgi:exodeoxyribonuclease VII large subunit
MSNIYEFTVSQFARCVKTLLEDSFGYVKINGEISGFKKATSGHLYFNLKDENALLSAVCFKGSAANIDFEINDGLQVCASGRITTYEGRSNYQIIVEKIEIAGIGAILEMIEKRRKKLQEEGLFEQIHKKSIPFLPKIIGVITSPTGAVIEDIKHRIENRFPTHILLYPSLMQGDKSAKNVIDGIKYFSKLKNNKPDLIIIARGGGSFEDLLPFNDEDLVRAVFNCEIPIISAIGHETDTTLIDYVADLRAPTPSAAAEMAVPVLADLKNSLNYQAEKLKFLPKNFINNAQNNLDKLQKYIISPKAFFTAMLEKYSFASNKLNIVINNFLSQKTIKLSSLQISKNLIKQKFLNEEKSLQSLEKSLKSLVKNSLKEDFLKLENSAKLLQSNNHQKILKRGFALVKDENGKILSSISTINSCEEVFVEVSDGVVNLHKKSRQSSLF